MARASRGFSLVMVLVVMLAGMALLGGAFYLHGSFVGRSLSFVTAAEEENLMDTGIENGKAALLRLVEDWPNDATEPKYPRAYYIMKSADLETIKGEDSLRLTVSKTNLNLWQEGPTPLTTARGDRVRLTTVIFDLDYDPEKFAPALQGNGASAKTARAKLPPRMESKSNSNSKTHHTYLIRSTLEGDSITGRIVTEVAVQVKVKK